MNRIISFCFEDAAYKMRGTREFMNSRSQYDTTQMI